MTAKHFLMPAGASNMVAGLASAESRSWMTGVRDGAEGGRALKAQSHHEEGLSVDSVEEEHLIKADSKEKVESGSVGYFGPQDNPPFW